jgi:RNA polymerase sigma-70 factor, ECF subfamily
MPDPHDPSLDRLMARFQQSLDPDAFQGIVSRLLPKALAVARQILSDPILAEDAAQEAFLRVFRQRDRYLPSKPFASWFFTILRRVCLDLHRGRARRLRLLQEMAHQASVSTEAASSEVVEQLDRLSASDRQVLVLRIVHELPFRDVGAALGVTEEAAKKRAQRALRRLRSIVEPSSRF